MDGTEKFRAAYIVPVAHILLWNLNVYIWAV